MSEYKQQLSALLDGELNDDEIRRLQPQVEAAEFSTASRYQMIASAMRGDVATVDVSDQVRVAILQEATLVIPAPKSTVVATKGWFGVPWLRPAGGLAVAASVALVLVLAVTVGQSPENDSRLASQAANQQDTLLATTEAPPATPPLPVLAVHPANLDVRPAANLNPYINAHSEFAAQDTMQGRMPYARAVTYESK